MKIIDMHCDTLSAMLNRKRQGRPTVLDQHHITDLTGWMQQSWLSASKLCLYLTIWKKPKHLCRMHWK